QAGPADLQVGDRTVVGGEQVPYEGGGVVAGVDMALAGHRPPHLGGGLRRPGQRVGGPVGDDPATGEDEDAAREPFRLGEVVGGQHDGGALQITHPMDEVVEIASGDRVEPGGRLVEE